MRAWLLVNLPIKIVALILAITLVIIKHEDQASVVSVPVAVRINHPNNRVLVSPVADKVLVTVEGRYADLDELSIPPLEIDLNKGGTFSFEPELFTVPPGLRVRRVRPAGMEVRFEEKKTALVPVRPNLHGDPQTNYRVAQVEVDPPTVKVEGAASAVDALKEALTERLTLVGRNQSATLEVQLISPPENVAWLDGNNTYEVKITIEEKIDSRVVADRPIEVQGAPPDSPGYEVSPPTADVQLSGPISALDGLDPKNVAVFVNVAGANHRLRLLKSQVVDAAAPAGLTVLQVRPNKVTLVKKDPPPPDAGVGPADAGVP